MVKREIWWLCVKERLVMVASSVVQWWLFNGKRKEGGWAVEVRGSGDDLLGLLVVGRRREGCCCSDSVATGLVG